jgi:tetratricopeptide (TPR) repeat protein
MPLFKLMARAGLGLLAVLRDDALAARAAYASLKPARSINWITTLGSIHRLLGLLAQTSGEPDKAAEHFDDALAFCRKAGYRPELAWTCCDYADVLKERDAEGDRAKAVALLDESLAISSELGMRPLMERVLSRREILGA